MSVNENVAFLKHRRCSCVVVMSVSDEKAFSALVHKHVVGENGKFKHHLVNLCVAVSAYAGKLVLYLVEQSDDLFGGVSLGQVVARTVVENITEEDQLFSLFRPVFFKCSGGAVVISVNVGCKHYFHVGVPFVILA